MEKAEKERRLKALTYLFTALGTTKIEAENLAAFVQVTSAVPPHWLEMACARLARSWSEGWPPKPAHVIQAAIQAAGMETIAHGQGFLEPALERIRQWPPPGQRSGDRWLQAPRASVRLVEGGRDAAR